MEKQKIEKNTFGVFFFSPKTLIEFRRFTFSTQQNEWATIICLSTLTGLTSLHFSLFFFFVSDDCLYFWVAWCVFRTNKKKQHMFLCAFHWCERWTWRPIRRTSSMQINSESIILAMWSDFDFFKNKIINLWLCARYYRMANYGNLATSLWKLKCDCDWCGERFFTMRSMV